MKQALKELRSSTPACEPGSGHGCAAQGRCRLARPATLLRGRIGFSRGLPRPESVGCRPRHQQGRHAPKRHQLGHAPVDRCALRLPVLRGLPHKPLQQRLLDDRSQHGPGLGQDFGLFSPRCPSPSPRRQRPVSGPRPLPRRLGGRCLERRSDLEVIKQLIAQIGRPAAYLKDGGSELTKAWTCHLEPKGLTSLYRRYRSCCRQHAQARLSAPPGLRALLVGLRPCLGASSSQTLLASLAPHHVPKPTCQTCTVCSPGPSRLLTLSPPGGQGKCPARLRACINELLPACKDYHQAASGAMPKACWRARRLSETQETLPRHPGPGVSH